MQLQNIYSPSTEVTSSGVASLAPETTDQTYLLIVSPPMTNAGLYPGTVESVRFYWAVSTAALNLAEITDLSAMKPGGTYSRRVTMIATQSIQFTVAVRAGYRFTFYTEGGTGALENRVAIWPVSPTG